MAGAGKKRAHQERGRAKKGKNGNSPKSDESPPSSGSPSNPPQSLPGPLDGNRDPARRGSNASAAGHASGSGNPGPAPAADISKIVNRNVDLGALMSYKIHGVSGDVLHLKLQTFQTYCFSRFILLACY